MNNNNIVSGVFWSLGERVIAQLVSFSISIVLARMLSPDDYGVVAILLIFISLADVFVSNGFGTALIQDKNADKDDFSTLFFCSLTVSIVIYCLLFLLAPFIADFYNDASIIPLMRVLAIRIPISAYNTIQRAYISRNMMFQKFFFVTLIGTTISAVIGIYMAFCGAGAWALVAQYLTNAVVDSITLSGMVEWKPTIVFKVDRARKLLSYGWKILAAEFVGTLFDQIQSLLIGKTFTAADLAYYNKGNQIPNMISSNINNSVMTVLFPAISNKGNDYKDIKNMSQRAVRMMMFIVFPLMFGLALVARPLILILLTDKWAESIQYMRVLSFSVAFSLVGNTGLQTIKAVGRSDLLLKIELYKKPVFILSLFIGMHFGVLGVAISATIYSFYAMVINFGAMGKIIQYTMFEQMRDLIDVGKLAVLMSGFVWLVNLLNLTSNIADLILKCLVGGVSYILLSLITHSKEFKYAINLVSMKLAQ